MSEDKRRTKSDELDIASVMRPLHVLGAEMDALVCKGEDAGIPLCLSSAAYETCTLASSPHRCPKNSKAERDAKAVADAEAERDRRRASLKARGIPARTLRVLESTPLANTPALQEVRAFLADRDLRILVLSGPKGCGKTMASAWAIAGEGREGRFVDVPTLMRIEKYSDEAMRPLEHDPLLVIDDLGAEYADTKGNFLSTLDGLINARYANDVRTIVTTNQSSKTFQERYDERIIDRIREVGRFRELVGPSLRGVKP